jgi:hypothetical protein
MALETVGGICQSMGAQDIRDLQRRARQASGKSCIPEIPRRSIKVIQLA